LVLGFTSAKYPEISWNSVYKIPRNSGKNIGRIARKYICTTQKLIQDILKNKKKVTELNCDTYSFTTASVAIFCHISLQGELLRFHGEPPLLQVSFHGPRVSDHGSKESCHYSRVSRDCSRVTLYSSGVRLRNSIVSLHGSRVSLQWPRVSLYGNRGSPLGSRVSFNARG
jgi:hypothetical protein